MPYSATLLLRWPERAQACWYSIPELHQLYTLLTPVLLRIPTAPGPTSPAATRRALPWPSTWQCRTAPNGRHRPGLQAQAHTAGVFALLAVALCAMAAHGGCRRTGRCQHRRWTTIMPPRCTTGSARCTELCCSRRNVGVSELHGPLRLRGSLWGPTPRTRHPNL